MPLTVKGTVLPQQETNVESIKKLEDNKSVSITTNSVDMELDDYHLQRLRELGLDGENPTDKDDPYNLVSYR